jgi:methyl-accepting chemotaxis protein
MNAFFTDSIKGNSERLNVLLLKLRKLLEQGYKAKILLKGYTSSIASNEYNKNLAKRRVKSLMNYINQYSSGCLKGFISNGNLEFQLLEIGEDESQEISDNLNDLKNSVYSLKASYSRKISILKIKLEL